MLTASRCRQRLLLLVFCLLAAGAASAGATTPAQLKAAIKHRSKKPQRGPKTHHKQHQKSIRTVGTEEAVSAALERIATTKPAKSAKTANAAKKPTKPAKKPTKPTKQATKAVKKPLKKPSKTAKPTKTPVAASSTSEYINTTLAHQPLIVGRKCGAPPVSSTESSQIVQHLTTATNKRKQGRSVPVTINVYVTINQVCT